MKNTIAKIEDKELGILFYKESKSNKRMTLLSKNQFTGVDLIDWVLIVNSQFHPPLSRKGAITISKQLLQDGIIKGVGKYQFKIKDSSSSTYFISQVDEFSVLLHSFLFSPFSRSVFYYFFYFFIYFYLFLFIMIF